MPRITRSSVSTPVRPTRSSRSSETPELRTPPATRRPPRPKSTSAKTRSAIARVTIHDDDKSRTSVKSRTSSKSHRHRNPPRSELVWVRQGNDGLAEYQAWILKENADDHGNTLVRWESTKYESLVCPLLIHRELEPTGTRRRSSRVAKKKEIDVNKFGEDAEIPFSVPLYNSKTHHYLSEKESDSEGEDENHEAKEEDNVQIPGTIETSEKSASKSEVEVQGEDEEQDAEDAHDEKEEKDADEENNEEESDEAPKPVQLFPTSASVDTLSIGEEHDPVDLVTPTHDKVEQVEETIQVVENGKEKEAEDNTAAAKRAIAGGDEEQAVVEKGTADGDKEQCVVAEFTEAADKEQTVVEDEIAAVEDEITAVEDEITAIEEDIAAVEEEMPADEEEKAVVEGVIAAEEQVPADVEVVEEQDINDKEEEQDVFVVDSDNNSRMDIDVDTPPPQKTITIMDQPVSIEKYDVDAPAQEIVSQETRSLFATPTKATASISSPNSSSKTTIRTTRYRLRSASKKPPSPLKDDSMDVVDETPVSSPPQPGFKMALPASSVMQPPVPPIIEPFVASVDPVKPASVAALVEPNTPEPVLASVDPPMLAPSVNITEPVKTAPVVTQPVSILKKKSSTASTSKPEVKKKKKASKWMRFARGVARTSDQAISTIVFGGNHHRATSGPTLLSRLLTGSAISYQHPMMVTNNGYQDRLVLSKSDGGEGEAAELLDSNEPDIVAYPKLA